MKWRTRNQLAGISRFEVPIEKAHDPPVGIELMAWLGQSVGLVGIDHHFIGFVVAPQLIDKVVGHSRGDVSVAVAVDDEKRCDEVLYRCDR
jgi:hypothetical protein